MMSLCACDLKDQGSIQAVAVPNNGVNRVGDTKGQLTGSVSQTANHKNWKPQPFALHCPPLLVCRRRCLFLGWMKGSDTDIIVVFPILSLTLSHTTTLTRLFLQQFSLLARPRLFLLRFPALFPSLLCFSLQFLLFTFYCLLSPTTFSQAILTLFLIPTLWLSTPSITLRLSTPSIILLRLSTLSITLRRLSTPYITLLPFSTSYITLLPLSTPSIIVLWLYTPSITLLWLTLPP